MVGKLLSLFLGTPPKFNIAPVKIDGNGRLLSSWDGVVSGAMSNFQGVVLGRLINHTHGKGTSSSNPFSKPAIYSAVRRGHQTSPLWLEKPRHWSNGIEPISTNSIKPMLPVKTISACITVLYKLQPTQKQGYGVVSDPFENAFFSELSTWYVGIATYLDIRLETSLFIFHTICKAGQHKSIFWWYLRGFVKTSFVFLKRFFALQRQAESKGWHRHCVSTWSFSRAPKLVYRFACLSNLLFWFELPQRMLTSPPHPMTWHQMRNINMFMYTRKTQ